MYGGPEEAASPPGRGTTALLMGKGLLDRVMGSLDCHQAGPGVYQSGVPKPLEVFPIIHRLRATDQVNQGSSDVRGDSAVSLLQGLLVKSEYWSTQQLVRGKNTPLPVQRATLQGQPASFARTLTRSRSNRFSFTPMRN